jgi:hypothetical protein
MRGWPALLCAMAWANAALAEPDEPIRARLILALKEDSSAKLRALAAKRLGEIESLRADRSVDQALIESLEDQEPLVRSMAARSLGLRSAVIGLPRLTSIANHDGDAVVRDEATRALAMIRAAEAKRIADANRPAPAAHRNTVELGSIAVDGAELTASEVGELEAGVRDLVETTLEPHLPAMFPREDAGYRFDVRVKRNRVKSDRKIEIRCEVSIVILELPSAHLRHATQAVASGSSKSRGPRQISSLEARVAAEATQAAMKEALALLQ